MNFMKIINRYKNSCKFLIALICLTIILSCENNIDSEIKSEGNSLSRIELQDGTVKLQNKTALKDILNSYKQNVENQNEFNDKIREIQNKGFKPLTPIFEENDTEKIQNFLARKKVRIQKRNLEFGFKTKTSKSDEEIEFDDEVISDPAFAALLNEEREIYVGDSIYKYTETGLYFCLIRDEQKLDDYLNKLSPTAKKSQITNRPSPCLDTQKSTSKVISEVTEVSDGIMLFIPSADCSGGGGIPFPTPSIPRPTFPPTASPRLIKQNLEICTIQKQGFFEKIFGESESDEDYFADGRRVKTSFWNQNYFLFSSIGTSVRFQKRVKILGISGWQKSYAEKIELGVNAVKYDFSFDVPQYTGYITSGLPALPAVLFVYKGTNYDQLGRIIPETIPTQGINFPFSKERSGQNAIEIHLFTDRFYQVDYDLSVDGANDKIYETLGGMVKSLTSNLSYNDPNKKEIETGLSNEDLIFDVAKVVPSNNKVTFISIGEKWTKNDDNAVTHYFDYNFVISLPKDTNNIGSWARALLNAKSYSNVKADVYGAALNNGVWKGRRLIKK
jgi:hypothetical protein